MTNVTATTPADTLIEFSDVLYLTNTVQIPPEIKQMFKQKLLSHITLAIDDFPTIRDRLYLIGTVVIDTMLIDVGQHRKLPSIIETLEVEQIGVIMLSGRINQPVKSFSISPASTSFSMSKPTESLSIEDLWSRISQNLAYRKKTPGLVVKPGVPPKQLLHGNKLAEQLRTAELLVSSLGEQLRLAGLVQRDFLPSKLPASPNLRWSTVFLPAEWVSGDIYDVVRLDEKHIAFYIVDAVGHSMPAALLTIFIKQALVMRCSSENSYRLFSPAEVMANLNIRMAGQKLSGYQFATCCYCLLNTATMELTCARAGHPYPIILKKNGEYQTIEARGSLLGIFEQAEYTEQTVKLESGDRLILYSDGAEPFIGGVGDDALFHFTESFNQIKSLPVVEMMDKFTSIAQNQKITPSEIDDITALALEVV